MATVATISVVQTPMVNNAQLLPLGLNAMGLLTTWPDTLTTTTHLALAAGGVLGLTLLACAPITRRTLERMTT